MKLVIVESPAKAKKIAGFLGEGWRVEASGGHVRDLLESELGVDVENSFRASYAVIPGKERTVKRIQRAVQEAEAVYVATDPDREGEAIAWHLLKLTDIPQGKPVYRAVFHAITADAVRAAIASPRSLDRKLVDAQHTRRIVDRLVGYLVSPLASSTLGQPLSAGRVQSASLRLVVDRERVIRAFVPQTRYGLSLNLEAAGIPLGAELVRVKGYDLPFASREFPDKLASLLQNAVVWVRRQARREQTHNPPPPFTTAALQQAAATRLGYTPERTLQLAQMLYETGRITYHRTDGLTVAPEAQTAARALIQRDYGDAYLPPEAPQHRVRALNAQEAHEAIRPVDVDDLPRDSDGDAARLYALIWKRFVASQMQAARFTLIGAQIAAGRSQDNPYPVEFRARGRTLAFDGYRRVDAGEDQDVEMPAPTFTDGQTLTNHGAQVDEIVSRAPARYSEATLIEALERHGIGRPSTYASTLKTLKQKGYVKLDGQQLVPTIDGEALCEYLTAHFPDLFTADYTARLEEQLDRVAAGEVARDGVLDAFWSDFQPALAAASGGHASRPVPLRPLED